MEKEPKLTFKIYDQLGGIVYKGIVEDSSYTNCAVMERKTLTLHIKVAVHIEIPIGSYCEFQGERYTLMRPENIKMEHSRDFKYTIIMESEAAKMRFWKLRNPVDGRLKFCLTAKPHEHLQMIISNLNQRENGWIAGDCVDDHERTIYYDHHYLWDALAAIAEEFKTEFEVSGKTISLHKVEYNKHNPLPLSYGMGNGFKNGVGRINESDQPPVEILYVQGGEQNIDPSQYKFKELRLPANGTISYDGEHFEDETGYSSVDARSYAVAGDRLSIYRTDKAIQTMSEDSLDCTDIYPKRVGKITEVVVVDEKKNFYDFTDETIPETLDFNDHLIEGEQMSVIFQTGMLAGREFDVKYVHKEEVLPPEENSPEAPAEGDKKKEPKKGRRFEIVPQEYDGETMPNNIFKPAAGDDYAVFNCRLPQEYINDPKKKEGAEWEMFRSAVRYKYQHEEENFTFTGTLDGIWAKKDWINVGGRLVLGGFVLFSDERFEPYGVKVRISAIKQYVNNPHSPQITLSNSTMAGGVAGALKDLESQEVQIEEQNRETIRYAKRRFRDAKETSSMLEQLVLHNFSGGLSPISIQTMQMLVGDESLQFRFVNSDVNPQPVGDGITYDPEKKKIEAKAAIIQHMTIGISSLAPNHKDSDYRFWNVKEFHSARLDNPNQTYYLYINVPISTEGEGDKSGEYRLETAPVKFEEGGQYHLLVGFVNSEYDDDRSFAPMYGYTEILPSRITTEKVVSGDGTSYFDMANNAMKLGEALNFDGSKLTLKGTMVQSQSGDESPLGCYRGVWDSRTTYFKGDEVTYTINERTSTYRMISEISITGTEPTDTNYWRIVASGGKDGTSITIQGTMDGRFSTMSEFVQMGIASGIYIIDRNDTVVPESFHWVAKKPEGAASWEQTQEKLGNGYMDAAGDLWVAVENGWQDVGNIKGADGADGKDGEDGVSYESTNEWYQWHNSKDTAPTGNWTLNKVPQQPTDTTYRYLWNYEEIIKSNGARQETIKHVISADGRGIKSIIEKYAVTATDTAPAEGSSEWTSDRLIPTKDFPYLWNMETIEFTDGTNQTKIHNISTRGDDGTDGNDGTDGEYTEYRFQRNGSTKVPPELNAKDPNPTNWSLATPEQGLGWYIWATKARKDGAGALLEDWCTPFRVTPYDGKDGEKGEKGDSPACVFRGEFDPDKTYYGNAQRLDCVKYGAAYYIAQITAGEFIGRNFYPTNTSKWNPFGASFDSVATNLLLAENANVGGWIFADQKLKSQSGNTWLDGKTGEMRMNGTLQLSTAYSGTFTDVNLFYLPALPPNRTTNIGMTSNYDDKGKVCRLFNSSNKGGGRYDVYAYKDIKVNESGGKDLSGQEGYRLEPMESIELTCFELPKVEGYDHHLSWRVTNRYTLNEMQQETCKGRFPRILAMGEVFGIYTNPWLEGEFWDGRSAGSVLSFTKLEQGRYKISFPSGTFPTGYYVFVCGSSQIAGSSGNACKASVDERTASSFIVSTGDDESRNNGNFCYIIFSPDWSWNQFW